MDGLDFSLPEGFWREGFLVRLKSEQFLLGWGPLQNCEEEAADFGCLPFFDSTPRWWKAQGLAVVPSEVARREFEKKLPGGSELVGTFAEVSPSGFEASFRAIQGKIQRGEIEKAVPIVRAEAQGALSIAARAQILMSLTGAPQSLTPFGFWQADEGVLGATPEYLFERVGGQLSSMALAGSCPKEQAGTRTPLLKDPKELREHALVVEDLAERLKTVGWLRQWPTEVVELPRLFHLKTRLEVSGCKKSDGELLRLLHPTPAVGVSPRAYGHRWMLDLPDQKDRGLFGGPLVYRPAREHSLAVVAIRCMGWNTSARWVTAGCGIVKESQQDREFEEIRAKLNSIFPVLGLEARVK